MTVRRQMSRAARGAVLRPSTLISETLRRLLAIAPLGRTGGYGLVLDMVDILHPKL